MFSISVLSPQLRCFVIFYYLFIIYIDLNVKRANLISSFRNFSFTFNLPNALGTGEFNDPMNGMLLRFPLDCIIAQLVTSYFSFSFFLLLIILIISSIVLFSLKFRFLLLVLAFVSCGQEFVHVCLNSVF